MIDQRLFSFLSRRVFCMHHTTSTTSTTLIPLFWYFLKRPTCNQPVTGNGQLPRSCFITNWKFVLNAPDLNALHGGGSGKEEWVVNGGGEGELKVSRVMRNLHTTKLQIRLPHLSLGKHLKGSHDKCCNWQHCQHRLPNWTVILFVFTSRLISHKVGVASLKSANALRPIVGRNVQRERSATILSEYLNRNWK